jgi:hypothetical protein
VTPEDIGAGLSVGFLLVFWLAMMALNIAIYVFTCGRSSTSPRRRRSCSSGRGSGSSPQWLAGIGIAFIIPFGYFVTPFMWWAQVRKPRRQGRLATKPFWAPTVTPQVGYQPHPPAWPQVPPPRA